MSQKTEKLFHACVYWVYTYLLFAAEAENNLSVIPSHNNFQESQVFLKYGFCHRIKARGPSIEDLLQL